MSTTLDKKLIDDFDELIATKSQKFERKGKTMPYTSVNGYMFTHLSPIGLGLRLSSDDRDAFIKKFETKLYEQYGSTMREFVLIPPSLLSQTGTLVPYLEKSFNYS